MQPDRRWFQTHELVPESGIYKVIHKEHRLPHEVTLLHGQKFPPCAKCHEAVRFQLLRAAPDAGSTPFRIALWALPEMPEKKRG